MSSRRFADADLALDQARPRKRLDPHRARWPGLAHALLGATDRATEDLTAAIEQALLVGAVTTVFVAQAQLALLAARQGAWGEAANARGRHRRSSRRRASATTSTSVLACVATARVALHEGRQEEARAALARAHRLRPLLDHGLPWLTVEVGLELTRAHLALGEASAARTILAETERVLELRPDMGSLVEEARSCATAWRRPPGRPAPGR